MSDNTSTAAHVRIPLAALFAVVASTFAAVGSGAWFMATQSAEVVSLSNRFDEFKKEVEVRRDRTEQVVGQIDGRLNRIEALLTRAIATQPGRNVLPSTRDEP